MKKLLFLILTIIATNLYADDTATLQAQLNAGPVTLTAGHGVYNVTTLTAYHNFNVNGNIINSTATTGTIITVPNDDIKISNAIIRGQSYTTGNLAGVRFGDGKVRDTLANSKIYNVAGSGVWGNDNDGAAVINCNIYQTGYIACAFYTVTKNVYNIKLLADTFDRTQSRAATISQAAMILRGSGDNSYRMKKFVVAYCLLKMPYKPADWTAECSEIRYADSSLIYKTFATGGTIGFSVVGSTAVTISTSTFTNQKLEAIEYTGPGKGAVENCSISNQVTDGILFDYGANDMVLINNSIRSCARYCLNIAPNNHNTTIVGGEMITAYRAINLQGSHGLHLRGVNLKSVTTTAGTGQIGITLDSSTGDVDITGGSITGFVTRAITYYSSATISVNNIHMEAVKTSGTPGGLLNNSSVGVVTFGSDIKVN